MVCAVRYCLNNFRPCTPCRAAGLLEKSRLVRSVHRAPSVREWIVDQPMRRLNHGMKDCRMISRFDAGVRLPLDLLTLDRTARVAARSKVAASLYSQPISESSPGFINHS